MAETTNGRSRPNLLNVDKRLRAVEEEIAYPIAHAVPLDIIQAIVEIGYSTQKSGAVNAAKALEEKYLKPATVQPSIRTPRGDQI